MQKVIVTTTSKLTAAQKASIQSLVEPKLGKVTIEEVIDANIIGGVKIAVGGQEFDATISGRLEKLEFETDKAVVTSAVALTNDQKKQIMTVVEKKYGITELEEIIDPSILGGIKLRIGSRELDYTVKNKLSQLKQQLLEKI